MFKFIIYIYLVLSQFSYVYGTFGGPGMGVNGGYGIGAFGGYGEVGNQEDMDIAIYATRIIIDPDYKLGQNIQDSDNYQQFVTPKFPVGKEKEIIDYAIKQSFASADHMNALIDRIEETPELKKFVTSEMLTQIQSISKMELEQMIEQKGKQSNPRITQILDVGIGNRFSSYFYFDKKQFQPEILPLIKKYLSSSSNASISFLLSTNNKQFLEILPSMKLDQSVATKNLVCSALLNLNFPYLSEKFMNTAQSQEMKQYKKMNANQSQDMNLNHAALIGQAKKSGVDFSQRCPSGYSINDELAALVKNVANDADLNSELKKKISELSIGLSHSSSGKSNNKLMADIKTCDTDLQKILNMKNFCQLNAPLSHLLDESFRRSGPGEENIVASQSQSCDLKAIYQVNRQHINGKIRLYDKRSGQTLEVKLEMPLKLYQQMIQQSINSK